METTQSKPPRLANITDYPKSYRPSVASRILFVVLGIILFLIAALMVMSAGKVNNPVIFASGLMVVMGILLPVISLTAKVTLYPDRIEQSGLFGSNELRRQEIQGYRSRKVKSTTYIDLLPANDQLKKISVTNTYAKDGAFSAWLRDLRNLDEEDQRTVDLEIAKDESLGATPEERRARVASLRKTGNFITYACLAMVIAISIYPHPAWLAAAILILAPWLAIAMVTWSGNNFTIVELDKTTLLRKGSLFQLLIFPIFGFYMIFINPNNGMPRFPLDWQQLLLPSIIGGIAMVAIVLMVSRGAKLKPAILLAILPSLIVYSGGTFVMANGLFDHADARKYTLAVISKHRTTGKGAASYFGVTSRDNLYDGDKLIKVPNNIYNQMKIGDTICAQIHPGALGMKWESVDGC
jgi:hypothetical protein